MFDGPVVSLRSTTGYRLGSRRDQDAEDVRRSLPNQRVTDTARPAQLNLAVHGLSGEWSRATWTLPQERPEGECGGAHQFYTPPSNAPSPNAFRES